MLGLAHKGHLGPGADGDVTIYAPDDDKERMFALPRYVIKGGEVVVDDGELRSSAVGRTLHVAPGYDPAIVPEIEDWFERDYYDPVRQLPGRRRRGREPARMPGPVADGGRACGPREPADARRTASRSSTRSPRRSR